MSEEVGGKLGQISERLDQAARRLRSEDVGSDEATRLAGECAELASQAAAELERLARATPEEAAPGQEELL
jgi:ABC-type transporter Mla subunit MlaD